MESETQFEFSYAPGIADEQILGFEMAGEIWSQYLADDVSINIYVEMTDNLPENVIGGALPAIEDNVRYSDYRHKLGQDTTSDVDSLINRNQQDETDKFTAYFSSQYENEGYKVDNNEYVNMTRANAKALGLVNSNSNRLDGYIVMRDLDGINDGNLNDVRWNDDYSNNSVASNELDFLSVAVHEIGHVLGFVSGLDQANWLAGQRNVDRNNEDDFYSTLVGNVNNATPLDMLRYSQDSYDMSGDDENWIDMSVGGSPYLSFNGSGGVPIAYFSTGVSNDLGGDGSQASHWKQQEDAMGIMDPVLRTGQRREISNLDKQLFDAIGWDIKNSELNWQQKLDNASENAEDAPIEDRTNDVQTMINSSTVYNGRRGSSGGSWQTGLRQHIVFQTVDVELDFNASESEFKVAEILVNNYLSGFESNFTAGNDLEKATQADTNNMVEIEEVVGRLIENSEAVLAEYAALDLEKLGNLLSEQLEDILEADEASLIMSIG